MRASHRARAFRWALIFSLQIVLLYLYATHAKGGQVCTTPPQLRRAVPAPNVDASTSPQVPPSLKRVLFCISFFWDVTKLVYLEAVMAMTTTYRTDVEVLIVTNNATNVRGVLEHWGYGGTAHVWQAPESVDDNNTYSLLWAHKSAIEEQLTRKVRVNSENYTSVIYVEDDTRLSWAGLVSWALDTEVLEPLKYTRCMYRTEVSSEDGHPNLFDWTHPVPVNEVNSIDGQNLNPSAYENVSARVKGLDCGTLRDGTPWECTVHRHFISPAEPFQGMWMATRKQLETYMSHPYWNKVTAVDAELNLERWWGYPERSNSLNILIDRPPHLQSSCMVPYVRAGSAANLGLSKYRLWSKRVTWVLAPVATVEHLRNGYSATDSPHGKLPVKNALTS